MMRALLDTDILSAIMRQRPAVMAKARAYLEEHDHFTFSLITRYEVLRGLWAKRALQQVSAFEQFCSRNVVMPLTDASTAKAAECYADLYQRGELIGDADILIAASALVNGFGVVTNNENHFRRIRDLQVENWLT